LRDYLFFLSGEYKTLPIGEIRAVLEAFNSQYKVMHSNGQVLVVRTSSIESIPDRLALSHGVYEFLGVCKPRMNDIISLAREAGPSIKEPVAVRVRRIRGLWRELRRDILEKKIGSAIGKKVDLCNPQSRVVGFLTDRFFLGKELPFPSAKNDFYLRHPKFRPFFHPGVLLPKIARASVNLTRIKAGERLMDPFCGTGSFLIEAGLLGARVYGCDINDKMVAGCRKNLEHFGIMNHHLEVGDARQLKSKYAESFDAIATDPPYGISASTWGLSLEELYRGVFPSFYDMLKDGGYGCILSPNRIETEKYAREAGFAVAETYFDRVHAGLTRKILVIKK
jgi:tRNA (guanine10-N2)-dimethyltransferase